MEKMKNDLIIGLYNKGQKELYIGNEYVPVYESLRVKFYSDTFDWGNSGLGCKQLAQAIIFRIWGFESIFLSESLIESLVQNLISKFKSRQGFIIPLSALKLWRENPMFKVYEAARILEKNATLKDIFKQQEQGGQTETKERRERKMTPKSRPNARRSPLWDMKATDVLLIDDRFTYEKINTFTYHLKKKYGYSFVCRRLTSKYKQENNIPAEFNFGIWKLA